jgi:hypothetical protein
MSVRQIEFAVERLPSDQFSADYGHHGYLSDHMHSGALSLMDLLAGGKLGGPMTVEIDKT